MGTDLTSRQARILRFIVDCIRDNGYPPTIHEIGNRFRIASTNGVNDHLVALERKGYIKRSSKARAIQVTDKAPVDLYRSEARTLPLIGRVAAGRPVLAEENVESQIAVSTVLARTATYCLRVQGDSMVEDGILDGDIIVVDNERKALPGDVVVALVEGEVTVKRFFPRGSSVELRPANAAMKPLIAPADSVGVQGVVVALQRQIR
ncbi:MAG: transcriptional repressor LexA [Candidatus Hydrogenedentes bacterium]|nr:transcriptional repressor LexA [Candidatus Hydrogenedentota bacterium]